MKVNVPHNVMLGGHAGRAAAATATLHKCKQFFQKHFLI